MPPGTSMLLEARRPAHTEIDAEGTLYASAAPPREKQRGQSEPCHTDSKTAVTYKTPCIGCRAIRRCEAVIIPDEVTFGDTLRGSILHLEARKRRHQGGLQANANENCQQSGQDKSCPQGRYSRLIGRGCRHMIESMEDIPR